MSGPRVEIKKERAYFWHVIGDNNEIIARSASTWRDESSARSCAMAAVVIVQAGHEVTRVSQSPTGGWMFTVSDSALKRLCYSQPAYNSRAAAENGMALACAALRAGIVA
jgi:hypothetical protein